MKKLNKKGQAKGFTLTELVIVIVIIAILAAVLIPSMTGYVNRAKKSNATQEAASTYTVLSAWLVDNTDANGYEGKNMTEACKYNEVETLTDGQKADCRGLYTESSSTYTKVTGDDAVAYDSAKTYYTYDTLTAIEAFKEYLAEASDTTVAKLKTTVTALTVNLDTNKKVSSVECKITSSNGYKVTITYADGNVTYSDPEK